MFNFKALVATAAIAATSIFAPAAVEARGSYCYVNNSGSDVCILGVWRDGGNYKVVKSAINGSVDFDRVYCNPAHRYNYKQNMYGIACFEFS